MNSLIPTFKPPLCLKQAWGILPAALAGLFVLHKLKYWYAQRVRYIFEGTYQAPAFGQETRTLYGTQS